MEPDVNQEIVGLNPALTARKVKAELFGEMVSVDSIGRAPGCGPGSWGFETPPRSHFQKTEETLRIYFRMPIISLLGKNLVKGRNNKSKHVTPIENII